MKIPSDEDVLSLLERLDNEIAGDLESAVLGFKPWQDAKESKKVAVEYAVCLANAQGGLVVFGVRDNVRGRPAAIHGIGTYDPDDWRKTIYASTMPSIVVELAELVVPEGMDPQGFQRHRISLGAVDWSGLPTAGLLANDLDGIEIERARHFLRRANPESELFNLSEAEFLHSISAIRNKEVTATGMLLFGTEAMLREFCPQSHVQYILQTSSTEIVRNDFLTGGTLSILERIEHTLKAPRIPSRSFRSVSLNSVFRLFR